MAAERLSIIIPPPSARSGLAAVGPLRGSSRRRCRGACGKVWSSSSSGEATAWQLPQTLTVIQSLISGLDALTWGGVFWQAQYLVEPIFVACRNSDASCDGEERVYVFRGTFPCTKSDTEISGYWLASPGHEGSGSVADCSMPVRLCGEKYHKTDLPMLHRLHQSNTLVCLIHLAERAYER